MNELEYKIACTEVLEILKNISKDDYNKIPKKKIEILEMNKNKDYIFQYDINKTLEENNVSEKAQTIIAVFFRDYWATDKQRKTILSNETHYREQKMAKQYEKYNPENLFKNNKQETVPSQPQPKIYNNNEKIIIYEKEKWYKKIFHKILNFFRK